jgi:hypothetical protein
MLLLNLSNRPQSDDFDASQIRGATAERLHVAECELTEERGFKLPPEQWKAFLKALDRPAVANPSLHRLLSQPSVIELANRKKA